LSADTIKTGDYSHEPTTKTDSTDELVLSTLDSHVLTLTINLEDRRNPLRHDVLDALDAAIRRAAEGTDVRVIVITGAGDKAFSAGGDLSSMSGNDVSAEEAHRQRGRFLNLVDTMWYSGIPTIGRVQGYALAGGFGLALACDFVVASNRAVFGTPEVDIGLWPYMITVPLLRSMPTKLVLDLLLTGRRVSAEEGLSMGFVSRVVPHERLDQEVADLAGLLASKPATSVRLGRTSFYEVVDLAASDALHLLHRSLTIHLQTDDAAEGLAAFKEKRVPRWQRHGVDSP